MVKFSIYLNRRVFVMIIKFIIIIIIIFSSSSSSSSSSICIIFVILASMYGNVLYDVCQAKNQVSMRCHTKFSMYKKVSTNQMFFANVKSHLF